MASILPGFAYDIFISYRHNDNRSDWVTDFVKALEEELAATIKDPVSVYFDTNPHDGLLETHNVDKSVEEKLKCLIFIPIISQTYCDSKSFAWQHEFCAFNALAKEDKFGRDVKLSNGNITSRILPIKIHDLDVEDKATLEKETGGALRAIEFIFKSAGVNRPLRAVEDHPHDNANKIFYRDQVNKVANGIKEIITSLKSVTSPAIGTERTYIDEKEAKPHRRTRPLVWMGLVVMILGVCAVLFFNDYFKIGSKEIDRSVAVLAFSDLSPQHDQEWFSDGLSAEILNSLSSLSELRVMARTSSFYFKGKNATITEIGQKLGVAHVVEGTVIRIGDQLRITAQLIRAEDGFQIWSREYERSADDLFKVQTDIAENIAKALLKELSQNDKINIASDKPSSPQAFDHFLKGVFFHEKYRSSFHADNFRKAEREFLLAISLEPSYAAAYGELANLYDSFAVFDDLKHYRFLRDSIADIAYGLNPQSTSVLAVKSLCFLNSDKLGLDSAFFYLEKAYRINPEDAWVNSLIGLFYHIVGLPDLDQKFRLRAIERDPLSPSHFRNLAVVQYISGDGDPNAYIQKVLELDSGNFYAYILLADLAAENKDAAQLKMHIKKLRNIQTNDTRRFVDMTQGYLLALQGDINGAKKFQLNDQSMIGLYQRFILYYLLDDKETIITALDSAVALYPEVSYLELKQRIIFDPVRETKRFQNVLEKLKEKDVLMRKKYDVLD